jgi:hypothetical protein
LFVEEAGGRFVERAVNRDNITLRDEVLKPVNTASAEELFKFRLQWLFG